MNLILTKGRSLTGRLSLLYFLQFAVWGSYLGCLGQYLGAAGFGSRIAWFYSMIGVASILMPAMMGMIADRHISPARLLGLCHLSASLFMLADWLYAMLTPAPSFGVFFSLYALFTLFYLPTIALANTTTFTILKDSGADTLSHFPKIRIWGTIGFVAAMWFVNSAYIGDNGLGFTLSETNPYSAQRFQYTPMMLFMAGLWGLLTAFFTLCLPEVKPTRGSKKIIFKAILPLFRKKDLRIILIFAVLTGVCLQITNGFAVPFITHFRGEPEYASTWGANNGTMLFSLSQISEALCILLTGIFMRCFGIKATILTALIAWSLRYLLFAFGNTGEDLWMLVLSMCVYGIAFDFFNIAAALYVDSRSPEGMKGTGQGVLMLMSNGIGATAGILGAGMVVNSFCHWQFSGSIRFFTGDWQTPWLIFAGYSLAVAILFALFFRNRETINSKSP